MKASRDEALFAVLGSVREILKCKHPEMETQLLSEAFWDVCRECVRGNVIDREMRCVCVCVCVYTHDRLPLSYTCVVTVGVMGGAWMTSDLSAVKWMCLSLCMGQQFSRGEKRR